MSSTSSTVSAPAVVVVEEPRRKRAAWRPLAAATIAGSVLVTSGFGVWASLSAAATNTAPQNLTTGTLTLEMTNNGAGFSQAIANVAPADVVNRYITLTNTGSLEAKDLTLSVAATGSPVLITDGTSSRALRISVTGCSAAWNPTTGACSAGEVALLGATPLSTLGTTPQALTAAGAAIAAKQAFNLKISATLPDQNEHRVNGAALTNSIQGASADLTYTFNEVQRAGTTTNS